MLWNDLAMENPKYLCIQSTHFKKLQLLWKKSKVVTSTKHQFLLHFLINYWQGLTKRKRNISLNKTYVLRLLFQQCLMQKALIVKARPITFTTTLENLKSLLVKIPSSTGVETHAVAVKTINYFLTWRNQRI